MVYLTRNIERKINNLLNQFPVVLLIGARQVGKTSLAKQVRPDWKYFDLENGKDFDYITRDFDLFFREYPNNIVIDEAQESAQLFKELRGIVDSDRTTKNRFLLTGSSSPELLKNSSETLAGRIAIIEIGTMKINELEQKPLSNFYQLFESEITPLSIDFLKNIDVQEIDILKYFHKGTYPEPFINDDETFYYEWMNNYHQTYVNRDIRKLFPKLDSVRYRRFTSMLAGLSGTIVNKAELGRSVDVSEVSIRDYLEIADKTFLWRSIPSYEKSKIKSIIKMPKGTLRDSGLTHYLLSLTSKEMVLRHPNVGRNFESFVIEEIIKGLSSSDIKKWDYYYYRTKAGSEVDLILEGSFGTVPIEIKFGSHSKLKELTSLTNFVRDNKLPLGILINNSDKIQMVTDSIIQIPACCI